MEVRQACLLGLLTLFLFTTMGSDLCAQTIKNGGKSNSEVVQVDWNKLQAHPRLFANRERLRAIKSRTDSVTLQLISLIRKSADEAITAPKIVYPGGVSNLNTSRAVQSRILALSMAYRLFQDSRYLAKAKYELLDLAAVPDWGRGHFLDVGEACLAAGIGYDWLYEHLSTAERKLVVDAIRDKALIHGLAYKNGPDSWVSGNFNWNPVCHGGLTAGALAIAEEEPETAKAVVQRAVQNIPFAGHAYGPDGAFAEGPNYWSYGTSFYVLAVEALRTALGKDYDLERVPGFLKTGDYKIGMRGATGAEYNYSDYHPEHINEPLMFWFAREVGKAYLMERERHAYATAFGAGIKNEATSHTGKGSFSRLTPFALLWWEPKLLRSKKEKTLPLQWTASGEMPISVMRSAWNDPNATYVALKGGTPNNSHGHMDVGSFILETNGVRWAVDLGTENYDKMRAAKLDLWNYTQGSSRWTTFRVGPEAHNILRMNGERQLVSGRGQIAQLISRQGYMGAVANLTSLYAGKADSVTRTMLLSRDKSVTIHDRWIAKDTAVLVTFQWLTKATVKKTATGLHFHQEGKDLMLRIENLGDVSSISIQDLSKSTAVQDSDNPGLQRITITVSTPAGKRGELRIRAMAPQAGVE